MSWFENIPLLSFAFLMGRCRHCGKPISIQYPLVEAITGLLFWFSAYSFPADPFRVWAGYFWVSFLVLLAVSDIKWLILPHPFNNLCIVAGFIYSAVAGWRAVEGGGILAAVEGTLGAGALMVLLAHFFPKGLGGGDIKMTAAIGAWLGPAPALLVIPLAATIGAFLLVPLLFMGKASRKTLMPFGPFLALSAGVAWFFPGEVQYFLNRMT